MGFTSFLYTPPTPTYQESCIPHNVKKWLKITWLLLASPGCCSWLRGYGHWATIPFPWIPEDGKCSPAGSSQLIVPTREYLGVSPPLALDAAWFRQGGQDPLQVAENDLLHLCGVWVQVLAAKGHSRVHHDRGPNLRRLWKRGRKRRGAFEALLIHTCLPNTLAIVPLA